MASNAGSALAIASFGFLCALAVGAVLLVGAKLQAPDLGAGASPLSILKSIVVVSLGGLGGSVEIGEVTVFAIPLGGLLFTALGLAWVAQRLFGTHRSLGWSLFVGLMFGAMCTLAALLCAIGEGADRIHVVSHEVLATGVIWGTLFSLIRYPVGNKATTSMRALVTRLARGGVFNGSGAVQTGLNAGLSLLTLSAAVAAAAGIGYVITRSSSVASALGIAIHAIAFLPNLAVAVVAFALGTSVDAGLGSLTSTGAGVPDYSLLDWKDGLAPAYMWLLTLLPLAGITAIGARVRRACREKTTSATILFGIGVSLAFAWLLSLVAEFGAAQVGADLQTEGFLRVSTHPFAVFGVALVWAAVGLPLGGAVAAAREKRNDSTITTNER